MNIFLDKFQLSYQLYEYKSVPEASGCSLLASAVARDTISLGNAQIRSSTNTAILVTIGTPLVKVPVLSNTMQFT